MADQEVLFFADLQHHKTGQQAAFGRTIPRKASLSQRQKQDIVGQLALQKYTCIRAFGQNEPPMLGHQKARRREFQMGFNQVHG